MKKNDVVSGFMDLTCVKMDLLTDISDAKQVDSNLEKKVSSPSSTGGSGVHGFRFSRNGK